VLQLERVVEQWHRFDIVHFHVDMLQYPLLRHLRLPAVTTLHGRLDLPDHKQILLEYTDAELISISDSQRAPVHGRPWRATVHHGLPRNLLKFRGGEGGYLAFLGRISPEKRVDRAVEIARLAGRRLRVAAKVDNADHAYYRTVKHLLEEPHVEFVGEITEAQKEDFLGNAEALLFPVDWPEPFGLVMIEALATGTPVIAYPCGSVPEVIRPGIGGFIVRSVAEAAAAVAQVAGIPRAACRREFETRFSAERMATDYVRAFREILRERRSALTGVVA
jgi:glycosyltransferase involved in cell wall biosynthesis